MNKATRLLAVISAFVLACLALTIQQSFGQGGQCQQNSSTNQSDSKSPAPTQTPVAPEDFSKSTWDLPPDADKTKSTVEPTEASIAAGKELFMTKKGNCIFCHGETGAGNKENLAKLRRVPANLSDHKRMPKLSDGEIFWKITRGIPGIMPGREKQLTEEERWHVVNFVRTLAKEKPKA